MAEDLIVYTPMYVTFFWAVVLLITNREDNRAKFFLGVFMFVAFLLYLSHAHFFLKIHTGFQFIRPLYAFASLSVYPLYFWYIKLLTTETEFRWWNLTLFIPAGVIAILHLVIFQLMSVAERESYFHGFLFKEIKDYPITTLIKIQQIVYYISRVVFGIQVIYFLIKGHYLIQRYNYRIINFYSNLENRSIKWVKFLLYSMVITSVASIVFNIIGRSFFIDFKILLIFPSLIFSILLFLIGLQGYMQNHTVFDLEKDDQNEKNVIHKNYNSAKLNEKLLELFVNEGIYKNPDLKITQISEMLHTNRTYISKHINTEFMCSFSDFVNRYRIEEAKRLLTDEASNSYSLNYVSEKSGFGSMGSFMRVFRDIEGITPGQFREREASSKK